MIPIFEPYLFGNEKKYLLDCIDTNWISSQGKYITKFEEALANYHGVDNAIATSNCTTALHLSLVSLGIGQGDEVICPDLTFIAPANMIALTGAKLVLVDVDPHTLTIDPLLIENKISKKTKAIILVHQFGHASHLDEIMDLSKKYGLKIIEDNAESIGAYYKNKILGSFGDIGTFSFFGNKIITSGEGGAIITNNKDIAIKCKELRDHGMSHNKKYYHRFLGFNYRMTNMQAAVALAQIENLDKILELRKNQLDYYYSQLSNIKGISIRKFFKWCKPVHWLTTVTLDMKYNRNDCLMFMKENKIDCRQMINPVHHADHFVEKYNNNDFPISNNISSQSIHLPSGLALTNDNIDYICMTLNKFLQKN